MKIEGEINLGDEPYSFKHDDVMFNYLPNLDKAGNVLRKDPNVIGQTTTYCGVLEYLTPGGVRVKGQFTHKPMGFTNWAILAKNGVKISLDDAVWDKDTEFGGYIVDTDKIAEPKIREIAERLIRAAVAGTERRKQGLLHVKNNALQRL